MLADRPSMPSMKLNALMAVTIDKTAIRTERNWVSAAAINTGKIPISEIMLPFPITIMHAAAKWHKSLRPAAIGLRSSTMPKITRKENAANRLHGGSGAKIIILIVKTSQITGPPTSGTLPSCVLRPTGLSTRFIRMAMGRKAITNTVTVRVTIIDKYMRPSIGSKSH